MRVLVCGGRHFHNQEIVDKVLTHIRNSDGIDQIIEGGAMGADLGGRNWAWHTRTEFRTFMADWSQGRKAGPIRNQKMLDEGCPDLVVAFPGGPGTADMVRRARKAGVPVLEVDAKGGSSLGI